MDIWQLQIHIQMIFKLSNFTMIHDLAIRVQKASVSLVNTIVRNKQIIKLILFSNIFLLWVF